jgi:hypothetical protein
MRLFARFAAKVGLTQPQRQAGSEIECIGLCCAVTFCKAFA